METVWQWIEAFGLPKRHHPHKKDPWHHCDQSDKWLLIHLWDVLPKRWVYFARTNTGHALTTWEVVEEVPDRLAPPIPPVVVVQETGVFEPMVVQEAEASEPTAVLQTIPKE